MSRSRGFTLVELTRDHSITEGEQMSRSRGFTLVELTRDHSITEGEQMSRSRGFTLIELAVVLAVIAILAAVLTPMVTGYIDQARETRAAADVRAIATAILGYQRDTSRFPVFDSDTDGNADTVNTAIVLQGTGDDPLLGSSNWVLTSNGDLDTYLNTNLLDLPTTARGGRVVYRGPYLNIGADPWGNAYLITGSDLTRASSGNHAYVLSAGANNTIDTERTQPNSGDLDVGVDDIVQRIR